MEKHLLKEQILGKIRNNRVTSLLFYTFNFDPIFFENYVLPIFVNSREKFTDNAIANQIHWRNCLKNKEVPEITIYCDDYAKNNSEAPALGYEVRCIRLNAQKGSICNFHPKHIFISLANGEMLMITGSGNITASGWCKNIETFTIENISRSQQNDRIKMFINGCAKLANKGLSKAEQEVWQKLLSSDFSISEYLYFNSIDISFKDFIDKNITDVIEKIEIISPYFSNNTDLLTYMQGKFTKNIHFLLPMLNNDEIAMDEEVFDKMSSSGASWHNWRDTNEKERERKTHAKIYRFYGENNTYTIVGSVNFTFPAWRQYESNNNQANIETAILYTEKNTTDYLLENVEINTKNKRFVRSDEREGLEKEKNEWRSLPPNISFEIDWQQKTLSYKIEEVSKDECFWKLNNEKLESKIGDFSFDLSREAIKRLCKNSIIEIEQKHEDGKSTTFFYYPSHLNFELKPLSTRLAANQIIEYWTFEQEEVNINSLLRKFNDIIADESENAGVSSNGKQLMNEWATHFSALIRLDNEIDRLYFGIYAKNYEPHKVERINKI
jgi:hypothetical protein